MNISSSVHERRSPDLVSWFGYRWNPSWAWPTQQEKPVVI